ncbi:MAG TPA: hypothetical protein VK149_03845 [Sideroxyarcus sp.]|nr:hypothetical protein [Sideroxyarcus sp.]
METLKNKLKELAKTWAIPPGMWSILTQTSSKLASGNANRRSSANRLLLDQNKNLLDKHKGERCFILGAGSSITKQDLKKLAGENVISVSNTFVHPDYPVIKPKYHVLPHIMRGHGNLYSEEKFVRWLNEMEQKTLDAEMFFHIGDKELIDNNKIFRNRVIHWNEYVEWNKNCDFPLDLSRVPAIWSVSEFAITVALYLGFDKIYLLGFDHDWFNGPLVYFYNHATQHALAPNADKLDFADSEFQMRRHADIFKKYKCLYLKKHNIYNANADQYSYVDVFPKVDFDSLF